MRIKYFKLSAIAIIVLSILYSIVGCTPSNIQIKNESMMAIKSVTLDTNIIVPEEPFVQGGNQVIAGLFLGGLGSAIEAKTASAAFQKYLEKNNIQIGDMVLESFKNKMNQNKVFLLKPNSETILKLKINSYGFGTSSILIWKNQLRKPMLNITATLVGNDSQILWQKTDFITNLSKETKEYTYGELAKDPDLVKSSFMQVSDLVTDLILTDLQHTEASEQAAK